MCSPCSVAMSHYETLEAPSTVGSQDRPWLQDPSQGDQALKASGEMNEERSILKLTGQSHLPSCGDLALITGE